MTMRAHEPEAVPEGEADQRSPPRQKIVMAAVDSDERKGVGRCNTTVPSGACPGWRRFSDKGSAERGSGRIQGRRQTFHDCAAIPNLTVGREKALASEQDRRFG